MLNPVLVYLMKLDDRRIALLIKTHHAKLALFKAMDALCPDDLLVLKAIAASVTELEFLQQELWGFPYDRNYHLFWQLPHCRCPKDENERRWYILHRDYFAYPGPEIAADCPIHGSRGATVAPRLDRPDELV